MHGTQRAHSAVSHEHVIAGIVHWSLFIVQHDNHFQFLFFFFFLLFSKKIFEDSKLGDDCTANTTPRRPCDAS